MEESRNKKEANKRIAKNTLFLYIRMILTVAVTFYTVRVLWRVLGEDNYGIYNVVGGIIMTFAFLNNAMVASSQRFISFELGRGNIEKLRQVFSSSLLIHSILAIVILLIGETLGVWFLNTHMNIPDQRITAANWVLQCSIFTFAITIISVPYNSCIVAHEHMKIFGYFSILDVVLRLIIVFLLEIIPCDKLISYAVLVLTVSCIMRLIYGIYCKIHFEECKYKRVKESGLIKEMFTFGGWSFLGNLGFSVREQGLNIILNMFFNVAVNAAKGVASQASAAVNGLTSSFQMAINPQITKRYASGEIDSMIELLYAGCRYSTFLISLFTIPLLIATEPLLRIWLDNVAPYTVGFVRLMLIMVWIDSVVNPITTSLQATGKIKKFQITIAIIMIASIPLAWIGLKLLYIPYMVIYIAILCSTLGIIARLILLHSLIPISYKIFIRQVFGKSMLVSIIAFGLSYIIYHFFEHKLFQLLIYIVLSVGLTLCIVFMIGLSRNEKNLTLEFIKNRFVRS